MSFMKTVVENNLPIWNNCMDTPFIQELWTGKLPENKFKEYMIQDSILNIMRVFTDRQSTVRRG